MNYRLENAKYVYLQFSHLTLIDFLIIVDA